MDFSDQELLSGELAEGSCPTNGDAVCSTPDGRYAAHDARSDSPGAAWFCEACQPGTVEPAEFCGD